MPGGQSSHLPYSCLQSTPSGAALKQVTAGAAERTISSHNALPEIAEIDATHPNPDVQRRLDEADRMKEEALSGLPGNLRAAIEDPDADLVSVVQNVTADREKGRITRNVKATLMTLEPEVVIGQSKAEFLRTRPRFKRGITNSADALENYHSGDKLVQDHAVFIRSELVSRRTSVLRGGRDRASKDIQQLVAKLGKPSSRLKSPNDPDEVVEVALWVFEEPGFAVRCTVRQGGLKNGIPAFWFERGVTVSARVKTGQSEAR